MPPLRSSLPAFAAFVLSACVSDSLRAQGLVAAFAFDEGTGSTSSDNWSGFGHVAAINGASWTPQGRYGNALSLDGANDWITVNDHAALDLTGGLTIEAWVYPEALGQWRTIAAKEDGSQLAWYLHTRADGRANGPT